MDSKTERKSYVIKPEWGKQYPRISHGKGIYLYEESGKRYMDACSGAVTVSIGHAMDEVVDAMRQQAEKVSFAYRSHFSSEAVEELADILAAWAPGNVNWSFFVSSGSEATETAQKIVIQYWQEQGRMTKNRILSRWMSYHGITMGALSMSGHVLRRKRFVPLLADYPCISAPYPYRNQQGLDSDAYARQAADELEAAIIRTGAENVAAFIAEPIIGASGGAVVPPDGYFARIREICTKHHILFIADEVMTGVGRTGKNFGIDHWQVTPDVMTLGKGMSSGYTPMAATMVSDSIMQTIAEGSGSIMAGHTYSANPQSAAICVSVIRYMQQHQLVQKAELNGKYLLQHLKQIEQEFDIVGEARGKGLLCGLEFVKNKLTKEPFALSHQVTNRIIQIAFAKGLMIYPAIGGLDGIAGDAVIISPPLIIEQHEIDELIHLLRQTLQEAQAEFTKEGIW
ncbi:aspartate aminotransferase family protein [Brevibacillus laterosporus]|uniref:aspartate aminotransferase family protein n=1 Tax=Brevibacillus laterosporus TaxID=1465 RepID=UPI00215BE925|nr:aspartate aminotransferase family protein [Brevibacillus laterosporus]MCR8997550.1 aspartate aminotransferase family protein [Brevibacillus laterosporus]